jgi:hypothetical protein
LIVQRGFIFVCIHAYNVLWTSSAYLLLFLVINFPFLNNDNMFHYFIFINSYEVLWSYSLPLSLFFSHSPSHWSLTKHSPFHSLNQSLSPLPGLSHVIWTLPFLRLPARACYIAGRHANKTSLCSWKPVQTWPGFSGRRAQHCISSCSIFIVSMIWMTAETFILRQLYTQFF